LDKQPIELKRHGRRFYVPAVLRREATAPWILTRSFDEELLLFNEGSWSIFIDRLRRSDDSKERQGVLQRIVASAVEVDFRRRYFSIPATLTEGLALEEQDSLVLVEGKQWRRLVKSVR